MRLVSFSHQYKYSQTMEVVTRHRPNITSDQGICEAPCWRISLQWRKKQRDGGSEHAPNWHNTGIAVIPTCCHRPLPPTTASPPPLKHPSPHSLSILSFRIPPSQRLIHMQPHPPQNGLSGSGLNVVVRLFESLFSAHKAPFISLAERKKSLKFCCAE